FIACALAIPVVRAATAPPQLEADTILSNGQFDTPAGWAAAAAIKQGIIVAIGDATTVNQLKGPKTRSVDLKGAAVLPGLHDMHVHPMGAGLAELACRFPQGSGPEIVQKAVQQCAAQHAKGEWITGGQWDAASFGATPPNREFLDRAAPNNPVVLT